jgi:hypothetical protein
MDDIQTQMDLAADIDQAISQPLGGVMFDEDELDAELEVFFFFFLPLISIKTPFNTSSDTKVAAHFFLLSLFLKS